MIPNELHFDQEGRDKLLSGIDKIFRAVKSTLGAQGNTVLIESTDQLKGLTITKDGVTVAKSISLDDPVENLAVRMVKEAAERTAASAGDGTTTSIVITEAIVRKGMELISKHPDLNITAVIKEINAITDGIIENLDKKSKTVEGDMLKHIASISSNNDEELGSLISEVYEQVGKDGQVFYEKSKNEETYSDFTSGIQVDRGWTNRFFVNSEKNDECILDDVSVLLVDNEISNLMVLENVLKEGGFLRGKNLLLIANCSQNVTNALAANKLKNGMNVCQIIPPDFGYRTHELMSDLAVALGGVYFSETTGDDLSLITLDDLGFAKRVIVGKDSTTIIKEEEFNEDVDKRVEELKIQKSNTERKNEKDFLDKRIASLNGGIGVVYVGGNSDIEQKEKYDRVEDAVCAVRAAIEEGVLPGGGVALYRESLLLEDCDCPAEIIMKEALTAQFKNILINAGSDGSDELPRSSGYSVGIDARSMAIVDMYEAGIIDPAKVTKNALQNAVSVATTILSTNAIVTLMRQ